MICSFLNCPHPVENKDTGLCARHGAVCEMVAEELHHCSTSELDFLNMNTVKTACRPCHRYTETMMSAEERRKRGLLIDPVNKKFNEPHKR